MLRFVIRKMVSKKWMVLALLIGNILLISITASNPMYTQAVLQRTLLNDFNEYLTEKNRYPGLHVLRTSASASKNAIILEARDEAQHIPETYGVPARDQLAHYSLGSSGTESNLERDDRRHTTLILGTMTGMADHIELVAGRCFSAQPDENGVVDVIVSERGLIEMGLIPEEELTFPKILTPEGKPVTVRIAGVFRNSDASDPYWVASPSSYSSELFMDEAVFEEWFMTGEMPYGISALWYTLLDYTAIRVDQVEDIIAVSQRYAEYASGFPNMTSNDNFQALLLEFQKTERKVRTTMWVLQAPIFVLLAAFIFMVSRQMLDMEQAEIAVIRSRGAIFATARSVSSATPCSACSSCSRTAVRSTTRVSIPNCSATARPSCASSP